jgi:DNA-binding transcriptional ArsR family regulator
MLYYLGMDKFSALADPTRRQIIELLAGHGEMSATDISDQFKMSAPAISQHLKVLREAQVVRMEKRGQQRIYRLNPDTMSEVEGWAQKIAERWQARYSALDEILETEKQKLVKKGNEDHE